MTSPLPRRQVVASVWLLGLTQLIGYGTLYYGFAILADDVAGEFGWPVSWVFGVFSLALLAGGFFAPLAGRWVDRYGAPRIMTMGSAAAAVILLFMAYAPPAGFVIGQVALEVAAALVLYDAAFAALVQVSGHDAGRRIMHLTLIGGFASTIFWPMTSALGGLVGWRDTLLVFAALNLLAATVHSTLPRHGAPGTAHASSPGPTIAERVSPPDVGLSQRLMWLVTAGFALAGLLLSAVLAQMVPMLASIGLGASAVLVSTLFGPAQVVIRFIQVGLGQERHPLAVTLVAAAILPLAVLLLAVTAPMTAGAAAFAILLGFGSGLKSIVQGTLPLALFGASGYAGRLGKMASVRMVLAAAAPFAFALVLEWAGPTTALVLAALSGMAGLACFIEIARLLRWGRPRSIAASAAVAD